MRRWKTWVLVGAAAVTVGLFLFATGAGAATRKAVPRLWGGGACGALMSDPDAASAMRALRTEHRAEMQAWWQKYGSDPQSSAAQQALQKLREEHRNDMRELFKKFGITPPANAQGRTGPGMMGGGPGSGCGGAGAGAGSGGCGGAGGCPNVDAAPGSSSDGTSYGPGMMGGGYGGMMGQSL